MRLLLSLGCDIVADATPSATKRSCRRRRYSLSHWTSCGAPEVSTGRRSSITREKERAGRARGRSRPPARSLAHIILEGILSGDSRCRRRRTPTGCRHRSPRPRLVVAVIDRVDSGCDDKSARARHLGVNDSAYARRRELYSKALAPLGITLLMEPIGGTGGFGRDRQALLGSRMNASPPPRTSTWPSRLGPRDGRGLSRCARAGGSDDGGPGIRGIYHPSYCGAFVVDPDGNNLEAVCHRPEKRPTSGR